ncbi:MAG: hypothetical protein WCD04_14885 [Terriglobia bacterium]|jgi:hypothetical protein
MTSAEIGSYGEQYVTAFLASKGFTCQQNTQLPGSTDIEATIKDVYGHITKALLVQVKTAVTPNAPADLSAEDKKAIVVRANLYSAEAWLAQVNLDSRGNQLGDIKWTKLN